MILPSAAATSDQDDRDAPVVEAEQAVVGVDVGQLGLDAEIAEQAQGVVAEVTALAGDQDDLRPCAPSA